MNFMNQWRQNKNFETKNARSNLHVTIYSYIIQLNRDITHEVALFWKEINILQILNIDLYNKLCEQINIKTLLQHKFWHP